VRLRLNWLEESFSPLCTESTYFGTFQEGWRSGRDVTGQERGPSGLAGRFRTIDLLFANTEPQRDSSFTKSPSGVIDHATSKIASSSKVGIDATKKLPGEDFKRP